MDAEPRPTPRALRPRPPLPTKTDEEFERAPENQPRGVTTAILFDWSLVVYLFALIVAAIVRQGFTSRQAAAAALLAVVLGLPLAILGEALRRGRHPARTIQIIVSGLLGAFSLLGSIRDLSLLLQGVRAVPFNFAAVIASVTIIGGLTRPQTIAWFARVTVAQARTRHGSIWLIIILLASLAIGTIWCIGTIQ